MFGAADFVYSHGSTLYIVDSRVPAVRMFDLDGSFLADMTSLLSGSLHVDEEDRLWLPIATVLNPEELWQGVQALAGGALGERVVIEQGAGERIVSDPGVARLTWTPYGPGALIVGRPETHGYRFEVQRFGDTVLAVERFWEPIRVDPEYAACYLAAFGDERPAQWPALMTFTRAEPDEIWVTRYGPGRRIAGCEADLSSREAVRILRPRSD